MSGVRWPELPERLKSRIAPDAIAPQKPRADLQAPAPVLTPTPELVISKNKRRRNEESAMSIEVANWRDKCIDLKILPEVRWFHAIPNGSNRGKRAAGLAKAEGQLSGVLDWFLPVVRQRIEIEVLDYQLDVIVEFKPPRDRVWHGLMIELKVPKHRTRARGGLKPLQAEYAEFIDAQGYKVVVCYTAAETIAAVEEYLSLPKPGGV